MKKRDEEVLTGLIQRNRDIKESEEKINKRKI